MTRAAKGTLSGETLGHSQSPIKAGQKKKQRKQRLPVKKKVPCTKKKGRGAEIKRAKKCRKSRRRFGKKSKKEGRKGTLKKKKKNHPETTKDHKNEKGERGERVKKRRS